MSDQQASLTRRLAVCSWSLQSANPHDLVAKLQAIGIHRVQLALDPLRAAPSDWEGTAELFQQKNVAIVSGMCGCVGEDYGTLDTIRSTGGIVPDATWDQNWANMEPAAAIASQLGLRLVTFHAGFLPHESSDPAYAKIQGRVRALADLFADRGIVLALETGQETAATLHQFLADLNRPNVGVNFDPANMILYDKGNPIEAMGILSSWIRQIHIKDARRTKDPGAWGEEVRVGQGEVDWPAFFGTLRKIQFVGDWCIEREAGSDRLEDIRAARDHIGKLIS